LFETGIGGAAARISAVFVGSIGFQARMACLFFFCFFVLKNP